MSIRSIADRMVASFAFTRWHSKPVISFLQPSAQAAIPKILRLIGTKDMVPIPSPIVASDIRTVRCTEQHAIFAAEVKAAPHCPKIRSWSRDTSCASPLGVCGIAFSCLDIGARQPLTDKELRRGFQPSASSHRMMKKLITINGTVATTRSA
jgi:hypothetical protein